MLTVSQKSISEEYVETANAPKERAALSSRSTMKQYIINLLLSVVAVFAPAKAMILSSGALIMFDLITGIMASRKQGIPITSSGLRRTVSKMLVYEISIILAFITQKYLTGDSVPVANIAAGFVGITELVSCMENLNVLSGNNLLKVLLDKLGSVNQPKP